MIQAVGDLSQKRLTQTEPEKKHTVSRSNEDTTWRNSTVRMQTFKDTTSTDESCISGHESRGFLRMILKT